MKKIIVFFISMLSMFTILISVKTFFLNTRYENIDSYELNTYFSIENNNRKIIHGESYAYNQCLNEEGKLEFKFELGTYDNRNEIFELSILRDFRQENFSVKGEKTDSYEVGLSSEENQTQFSVIMDAESHYQSSIMIFTLRQDTTENSSKNQFLCDSNTVNVVIELIYDEKKSKNVLDEDVEYVDVTEIDASNVSKRFQLLCLNREENKEIIIQPGKKLKMNLDFDLYQDAKYMVIWCNLNSKQVTINGMPYCIIKVPNNNTVGRIKLSISIPEEVGQYELEIFGEPINKSNSKIYQVMSTNRYTIKVE